MKRIFLDHNSTTPVMQEVMNEMLPYFSEKYGNPSSTHNFGQQAARAIDKARLQVSKLIESNSDEIVFTGSGTEANNLAILGMIQKHRNKKNHIITSMVEHSSVFNTCKFLEDNGIEVTYLPVDKHGHISVDDFKSAIKDNTIMASIMLAGNETGVVQDIKKIAAIAEEHRIHLHTDAIQAAGKIPVNVKELNIDMLSISGHKIYGPKGIGALYIRRGISIKPILFGGGQEKKIRSGTENVPAIIGLGKACEIAADNLDNNIKLLTKLQKYFESQIVENLPKVKINGSAVERIPNTSNISFAGEESESLLIKLDLNGIAVSSGSACAASHSEPSRTLKAMGLPPAELYSSLRFSIGLNTTVDEINRTIAILKDIAG